MPHRRSLGPGSIGRQLMVRVIAIVAIVAVLLSLTATLIIRQLMYNAVDAQLRDANRAAISILSEGISPPDGPGPNALADSVTVLQYDRETFSWQRDLYQDSEQLPAEDVRRIIALPDDAHPRDLTLADLGRYRFLSGHLPGTKPQARVVVGISLTHQNELLTQLVISEALLILGALLLAAAAVRAVLVGTLRPLNRLADTALDVSKLPLDRGEVDLRVRMPADEARADSEVGRVALAFNGMLDHVASALASRQASETRVRQFVADASHELRNPLASIRGYTELSLRRSDELPADTAHALTRVSSEASRMSSLVEDLLLLARLDSGPALDLDEVDVTEVVLNAVDDARIAGPGHEWAVELPDEPVVARADRHRLHQVVANLLANARTHTPAGTRVEASVTTQPGWAIVAVADDGPGIPAEIRDTLFERFTRADVARSRANGNTSSGLGLAIVSAVMEAHGGAARVRSEPGRTVFELAVPLPDDEPDADPAAPDADPENGPGDVS